MNRIITLFALLISVFGYSQVGIGTPTPNKSAELEILSANKGILIPRIALKSIDDATTIEEGNINSLLIFNTTDEGDLTPGYYYWYENRWVRMIDQSGEALKTPWQIQATDSLASQNTQNIYQQGKVAVGFTKNDSLSEKQFDVKGSIKVVDKAPSGYYNWLESSLDLTSLGFDNSKVSSNVLGVFEEPNFESLFKNASGMFTLLGEDPNGKGALLELTSILDSKHRSGLTLNSHDGQGAGWGNSTFTLSSTNNETQKGSDISGEETKLNLSVYDGANSKVELDIDTEKGITFRNLMGGFGGSYIFPSTKGSKNQVLTVGDPADPVTAQNTNQLLWKDVSDLVSQPWKIQATDSIALQNTQNIYQQGKVAVGFTKDDVISDKQLEVKGGVKALHGKAGGIYELFETGIDVPLSGGITFFDEHKSNFLGHIDSESIFTGNTSSYNFLSGLQTSRQTHQNGNKLGTSTLSTDIKDKAFAAIHTTASDLSYGKTSGVQLITNQGGYLGLNKSEITLNTQSNASGFNGIDMSVIGDSHDDTAKLKIDLKKGIGLSTFSEDSNSGAVLGLNAEDGIYYINKGGGYAFPKEAGTKNQVLSVDEAITITDVNHGTIPAQALVWKDLSALVSQPWKIQATDSIASQNTQNIYQQGKVAVGFTKNDSLSNKQFDVKGDFKFIDKTAHGYYNWLESDVDLTSLGADKNLTMNIFGSFEEPNFNALYNNAAAMYTGLEKRDNGEKASVLGFLSTTDGKYNSQFYLNSGEGSSQKANFSLSSMNTETNSASGIVGTSKNLVLSTQDNSNQSHLFIDPQRGGIMFTNRVDRATATESYIFPRTKGTKHQVLTVGDPATEFNTNKLEWKDFSDLVSQPWKIQNTENQATQNTQNIYQMGSVAIGVNSIPSFTVGSEMINPKLHVAGDVSTTGKLWTTNSVYADYVFEKYFNGVSAINKDYEFMTLDYIKEFVKANKHLPGVTPIKDLEKLENGYSFNITGLTVELLEKTEELFLHTIEQQQKIDELKSQVEENNKRLKMLEELFLNKSK